MSSNLQASGPVILFTVAAQAFTTPLSVESLGESRDRWQVWGECIQSEQPQGEPRAPEIQRKVLGLTLETQGEDTHGLSCTWRFCLLSLNPVLFVQSVLSDVHMIIKLMCFVVFPEDCIK